ncbi:MAG TPA: ribonuclease Y [Lactobacillus acetotolerans]|nr:ribonuclease Y [Lactobacillus acetotolerans]
MTNIILIPVAVAIISILAGSGIGYAVRKNVWEKKAQNAQNDADHILADAKTQVTAAKAEANAQKQATKALKQSAENTKKEKILEAQEKIQDYRQKVEDELNVKRDDISRKTNRLKQREDTLDHKKSLLDERENGLTQKENQLKQQKTNLDKKISDADKLVETRKQKLYEVAGLNKEQAKKLVLSQSSDELVKERADMIRNSNEEVKAKADHYARQVIIDAIQSSAADTVAETTVSVVDLPNEEMKGRIIGREGRNIRSFEALTGIDLIIDDTPEAVVLSGFDPIRREVARIALEKLIVDGRIHPARIEEMVDKANKEVESIIREEGEQAAFDTGIHNLHPEIIKLLGRLKYRTSYGQNVLKHSVEVSHLAGMMAAELDADVRLAKRAGLLHDLGKAVDHEVEGPHVDIGVDLARKYKESKEVLHAIAAHHGDIEPTTVEAVLVQAADAISAARPGARRETLEAYIKRLEKLEEIANSVEGVEKSYAIQAGREVRIMVKPDEVDETQTIHIAREIVKKIESELDYPGQIKVNVIRETRAIEYAK